LLILGQDLRKAASERHDSEIYRVRIRKKPNLANAAELSRYAIQWASRQGAGQFYYDLQSYLDYLFLPSFD
jgi:hypothetical protein